jgi:nitric oxide reductase subunit C
VVVAAWSKQPDLVSQGEVRFRQMMCTTCHPVAVTRAGETKIGGNVGPELTKVGSKVNEEWLVAWLKNPRATGAHEHAEVWLERRDLPQSFAICDEEADGFRLLRACRNSALRPMTKSSLGNGFSRKGLRELPRFAGVSYKRIWAGSYCVGCEESWRLNLAKAKSRTTCLLMFRRSCKGIGAVNPAARMPQYAWNAADLEAVTTALLSETGPKATSALQHLVIPKNEASFQTVGDFAEVYERYKCYACHRFNGYGGTLAPDLSYEGSRAQKKWIADFLKNPQTIRPTLILRMPQFNMTDKEAAIAAEYLSMAVQKPDVNPGSTNATQFAPAMAAMGKQLYEVKYQCHSCHTIGGSGGYVGPNLNNAGNWLTPAWIEAWLRNPQVLQADTIEPRRNFTEDEIRALTAYLMTLRPASSAHIEERRECASGGGRSRDEIETCAGGDASGWCDVRGCVERLQKSAAAISQTRR